MVVSLRSISAKHVGISATVLNWMLNESSAAEIPTNLEPYTEAETLRLRKTSDICEPISRAADLCNRGSRR